MRGRSWARIASRVSGGSESLVVHSTGWPDLAAQPAAGIANCGLSAGATSTAPVGSPAAEICSRSIPRASEAGLAPSTSRISAVLGLGRVADPDHLRVVDLLGAGRRQLLQRLGAGGRQLVAVREQHGGLQRARHQLRRRDRRPPVALVDDRHHTRAALVGSRRVYGARRAGRGRHRVAAGHARGVLRREHREAERRRVLRLLLVAAGPEHGLAVAARAPTRVAAVTSAVAVTAAAAGRDNEQE